jgi:hypothetical protein
MAMAPYGTLKGDTWQNVPSLVSTALDARNVAVMSQPI